MMSVHAEVWFDDNALYKLQRKKKRRKTKKKHPPNRKKRIWNYDMLENLSALNTITISTT